MRKEILLLFMINILSSIGYSLLAPLYPPVAERLGVCEFIIGLTFSCFAISNVITIPCVPRLIKTYGRINLMYFSLVVEALCTLSFSLIDKLEDSFIFSFCSILARLMHGFASALSSTMVYSIAASLCSEEELQSSMGYMELGASVGLTIGPVLASFLYYINGYSFPFFVCGILMLGCIPFIKLLEVNEEEECEDVEFFKVLLNPNILPTYFAIVFDMLTTTFFLPMFSTHLQQKYGQSVESASFFFIINMISYFMTLQILNNINNLLGLKLTMCLGVFINSIGVLLIHPIGILPQNLGVIILGLIIIGLSGAFITIPAIVDFMDTIKADMNISENVANDMAAALYNFAINTGEAVGPTFGGTFTHMYNFETASKATSLLNCIYFLIYLFLNLSTIKKSLHNIGKPISSDQEDYLNIKHQDGLIEKDHIKSKISYTPKYRAYSFSSLSSKRNSFNTGNQS